MQSRASDSAAVLYLQRRIIVNWFRRSMRSPFFWLVAVFIVFILVSQIANVIDGPDEPGFAGVLDQIYFNAIAAIVLLCGILVGFWRGTTNTPGASLADVVVLMGSPVSGRLQYALLMARSSLVNALIISAWALAASGGAVFGVADNWIAVRLSFSVLIVVLLSEFLRYAVWVGTEQVVARSPRTGSNLRLLVRVLVLIIGGGAGIALLWPALTGSVEDWREAIDVLVERGDVLASNPPMALLASVFNPEGASLLSAIGLIALTAGVAGVAIYWARDFVEPVSIAAERKTDARGQMMEAGSDVQWAALTQFGVSPRLRISVPAFGRGAWALLWGSVTRWVRYQLAAAWITIFILGILGALTAIAVRLGIVSEQLAWAVALMVPFFGSVNMFMDELRRQFIFLIPGSTPAKLTAAALTSVLDGSISSLVVIVIMTAIGAVSVVHAIGLLILGTMIALLGQASLALVQVLLPFWVGQRMRVSITLGLTALAFVPALVVLIALYIAISPMTGLIVSAGVTAVTGVILMIIAGLRFDRIEFSG